MARIGALTRRALDGLYTAAGFLAAFFLLMILCVIVAQMVARWSALTFPGSTAYAGYCMAAGSFLALAYTLRHGAHIRVTLMLGRLGRLRRWGELWCLGVGTAMASYFAYHAALAVRFSYRFGDVSQSQDATPLWIPQTAMAFGAAIFAIALADTFLRLLLCGEYAIAEPALEDESHGE